MRSLVVYESMFGNTHTVANAIAEGLSSSGEVAVLHVHDATADALAGVTLLVVGGPTHVHGMTSSTSRQGAVEQAASSNGALEIEPDAVGPGLRDWLADLGSEDTAAAAYDTRYDGPVMFTGRASKGIAHKLGKRGRRLVAEPESFLVDKANHLLPGEAERATQWGATVGAAHLAQAAPQT
jgi:hypothetical protein